MKQPILKELDLPDISLAEDYAELGADLFVRRFESLREKMEERALDFLVVYADREHAANFRYLTNFDPRFEEAILVLPSQSRPVIFLGNENQSVASYFTRVEHEVVHFPSLSLLDQPRIARNTFEERLMQLGAGRHTRVGVVGWKYFTQADGAGMESAFEIPHYIVETLRSIVGDSNMENATALLMHADHGLRSFVEPAQLAEYEYAASLASGSILTILDKVEPGQTELALARHFETRGVPASCHPMLSVKEKARLGLPSPSTQRIDRGDFLTVALGLRGALSSRAAYVASSQDDIPLNCRTWVQEVVHPYMAAAYTWIKHLKVGITGGEIYQAVEKIYPRNRHGWHLNPGHLIADDEWVSSPIYEGSSIRIKSGSYMQLDIIPGPARPWFGANIEDGYYVADSSLRQQLAANHPALYERMLRRRNYMIQKLGYSLSDDLLPVSPSCGYYRPYLLDRRKAFVFE
ncbi:M24 family metallopeptidase [Verminephrobacter aporrectodeae subsp. tuberculatae]|uniref:aminopeptidase P family protein n=1 Tax=Verminephrobacter aporrectodeae TaxID=1110389 RepID=UPI00223833AB|nr:aminopeptidase P family protein [Verminephrobacter aporrectodeae]MCW5220198.1 M24 family metallopeptidase [Verminephrobacter aporrectodeae subsp. tuberculatae]MCW5289486.1 M24 family metallopeptidase [Verminephrobacter aporrectodeae subsp. tuberculatae]